MNPERLDRPPVLGLNREEPNRRQPSRGGLTRPAALLPGGRVAIVSPASTPKPELVRQGVDSLEALGYRTVVSPHALDRGPLYYAGTRSDRLDDLHAAFADPAVDAILCTRGGWGSAELLPLLDRDLIRANPKPFLGYSDHTSLHLWLQQEAGMVSFYAPMVAADFARPEGVDRASWVHALEGTPDWSIDASAGLRTLREGSAEGTLRGGCLSLFAESLGTRFAPATPSSPTILFLEDIGTKPYQWDRQLVHLGYAGQLENVTGVVFGDMGQCVPPEEEPFLDQVLLHALRDFAGPIGIGLRCGHVDGANLTLPLGVRVELDLAAGKNPRMHFREAAVTV